jgi:hypothetical protein
VGRPRLGNILRRTYAVSLDELVAANLRTLGNDNLSADIAIAEYLARGATESRRHRPVERPTEPTPWIVFELVDGPADPPRPGEMLDPFRETVPVTSAAL